MQPSTLIPSSLSRAAGLLGAGLSLCAIVSFGQRPTARHAHSVTIQSMAFQPATLSVHPGDTIVWVNADIYTHDIVSPHHAISSPDLEPGKAWRFVAHRKGTFPYHCAIHPNMRGTLVVR